MENNTNLNWETNDSQENNNQPTWGAPEQQGEQLSWEIDEQQETQPTWGAPEQQETQPTWGAPEQQETQPTWGAPEQQEEQPIPITEVTSPQISNSINTENYSYLGDLERIKISTQHYLFNHNNAQAVKDLKEANLKKVDDDGRHSFDPKQGSELGNIIESIFKISRNYNSKIGECFIYKNQPQESTLNIFRHKPSKSFVYFLQGNYESSQLILDLSSLGGPSTKVIDTCEGILTLIPGWCNFKFTRNQTDKEFIAIAGYFE